MPSSTISRSNAKVSCPFAAVRSSWTRRSATNVPASPAASTNYAVGSKNRVKLGSAPLDAVIATRTTSHTAYAASTELNPAAIKSRRPGSPTSIRMDASSRVAFSNVAADEPSSRRTSAAKSASQLRHSVASVANPRIVPCSLDSTNAMTSSRPATCEYSVAGEIPRSAANPNIVNESKPSRTAASTILSRLIFGGRRDVLAQRLLPSPWRSTVSES